MRVECRPCILLPRILPRAQYGARTRGATRGGRERERERERDASRGAHLYQLGCVRLGLHRVLQRFHAQPELDHEGLGAARLSFVERAVLLGVLKGLDSHLVSHDVGEDLHGAHEQAAVRVFVHLRVHTQAPEYG